MNILLIKLYLFVIKSPTPLLQTINYSIHLLFPFLLCNPIISTHILYFQWNIPHSPPTESKNSPKTIILVNHEPLNVHAFIMHEFYKYSCFSRVNRIFFIMVFFCIAVITCSSKLFVLLSSLLLLNAPLSLLLKR